MTWLALRLFFGKAWNFIIAHWQIVAVALIVAYALHYKHAYEGAVKEIAAIHAQIEKALEIQSAKDVKTANDAEILRITTSKAHQEEIAILLQDYNKLVITRDQLKKELISEKDNINRMLNDAYQLRIANSGNGTSDQVPSTITNTTEGGADCNATLATVVKSCQVTTADYNELATEWENNCQIYGCKDIEESKQ